MTHEPDIIREAEAVIEAMQTFRDATSVTVEQAHRNLLAGIANPSPLDTPRRWCAARFTYDGTQSDPGDEHKERV